MILEEKEQKQKLVQEYKSQRCGGQKTEGRRWRFFEKCTGKYLGNISWENAASHIKAWACGKERNYLEQFLIQVAVLSKTKIGDKVEDRVGNQPQQEKEARPNRMK